jgi:hypothetical protein
VSHYRPGSLSAYTNGGCRCDECRQTWRDYRREHQRELARGEYRTVSVEEARRHAKRLVAAGYAVSAIADAADMSRSGVQRILAGETSRIRRDYADRILAVPLDDPLEGHRVPRRLAEPMLEAIADAGFSLAWLYEAAGLNAKYWTENRCGARRMSWDAYRRISTVYRLLASRGLVSAEALAAVSA